MTEANTGGRGDTRVIGGSALCAIVGTLPLFLVAGLAVYIRAELGFGEAGLGLAVSAFFGASALASTPGGAVAERLGAATTLRIGVAGCAACATGIALLADSLVSLTALLALGGATNGFIQPSTNLVLVRGVRRRRQALAFGTKHAAVPSGALLAGLAVPTLGATVGWRWAFVMAAVLGLLVLPFVPGAPTSPGRRKGREGDADLRPLLLLTAAAGCGAFAANSMTTFLVESAVALDVSPEEAGLYLSVGGVASVASRILIGWVSGHRPRHHLVGTAALFVLGAVGFVALASAGAAPRLLIVVGTVLGFAAGWGWPGLFTFAIVRWNRNAPAAATGITQTGIFTGAVVGPITFGAVVATSSYQAAWSLNAAVAVIGAALMLIGRRMLLRSGDLRGSSPAVS